MKEKEETLFDSQKWILSGVIAILFVFAMIQQWQIHKHKVQVTNYEQIFKNSIFFTENTNKILDGKNQSYVLDLKVNIPENSIFNKHGYIFTYNEQSYRYEVWKQNGDSYELKTGANASETLDAIQKAYHVVVFPKENQHFTFKGNNESELSDQLFSYESLDSWKDVLAYFGYNKSI